MKNLIIPCAGRSSRFPNMKPKWMLTHPDGELMVKKAIDGLPLSTFDRIIITIVKQHVTDFDALIILEQLFSNHYSGRKFEFCILDDFTNSQSETIYLTIKKMNIIGGIVIKDSDNYVAVNKIPFSNFIVGINLYKFKNEINRLKSKSFLKVNDQNILVDIIEKQISSNIICVGIYGFISELEFNKAYLNLKNNPNELYLSHIISYLIGINQSIFYYEEAINYDDWGTLEEWTLLQSKMRSFFIDLDGVLFSNVGKYGKLNWSNSFEINKENLDSIKEFYRAGAQIVLTTSRSSIYKERILKIFNDNGINIHAIIMDLNHSSRVLINDFAPTNPYPSALAVNLPRNSSLKQYIEFLKK